MSYYNPMAMRWPSPLVDGERCACGALAVFASQRPRHLGRNNWTRTREAFCTECGEQIGESQLLAAAHG